MEFKTEPIIQSTSGVDFSPSTVYIYMDILSNWDNNNKDEFLM